MSRKVGIIGSGIVGETLANGFIKHDYQVTIGTNTSQNDSLMERLHKAVPDVRFVKAFSCIGNASSC